MSGFSTEKAGGFGERMRSEETLSARGKREKERDRQKTGYGGRPEAAPSPHPASGPNIARYLLRSFHAAAAERQRTGTPGVLRTRKVFDRAMAHNTRQPTPRYKYTVGG